MDSFTSNSHPFAIAETRAKRPPGLRLRSPAPSRPSEPAGGRWALAVARGAPVGGVGVGTLVTNSAEVKGRPGGEGGQQGPETHRAALGKACVLPRASPMNVDLALTKLPTRTTGPFSADGAVGRHPSPVARGVALSAMVSGLANPRPAQGAHPSRGGRPCRRLRSAVLLRQGSGAAPAGLAPHAERAIDPGHAACLPGRGARTPLVLGRPSRTRGRAGPPDGTGATGYAEGRRAAVASVDCILLDLSAESHKRRFRPQAPDTLDRLDDHMKHPRVNKMKTASTYHINTANQVYIFFSYIKDITVKKDCTVFITTDPYSLETLENKCHSPTGQIL